LAARATSGSVAGQTRAEGAASGGYDVLVLDAGYKQSLASVRSFGRIGLRVAMAESFVECDPDLPVPGFRSRYCAREVVLPNHAVDAGAFADAVVDFVTQHPTRVVLPTGDGSIAALRPARDRLAALGSTLALAPDEALSIAVDKDQTLELARKLDIDLPKTMRIDDLSELADVLAEFSFPFVLKPAISWTGHAGGRLVPVEVVNSDEASEVTRALLAAGSPVLAQTWACGRREGVTLFIVDGTVLASCAHVAHRTSPQLGGASVMRESIPMPPDIYAPAVRLATAIGMQGVCEVEFRRDADNRPLLMEINPRLAGTIENAMHSGVDFPLLIWQWAAGLPVTAVDGYRTGVRTRWLHGDLRWLRDNQRRAGRPDSVPKARGLWIFGAEFARTRYYDCFSWRDPRPGLAELRMTVSTIRKQVNSQSSATGQPRKGA